MQEGPRPWPLSLDVGFCSVCCSLFVASRHERASRNSGLFRNLGAALK